MIQDELNAKTAQVATSAAKKGTKYAVNVSAQATKFTAKLLKNIFKAILISAGVKGVSLGNGGKSAPDISHGKIKADEFMAREGKKESINIKDTDAKDFEKKAKHFGVDFTIVAEDARDEKGNQLFDYSKCKIMKDENGLDLMDENGKPKLAEDSLKPEPLKEFSITFMANDAMTMENCIKSYLKDHEKKLANNKRLANDPDHHRINIKEMIVTFAEKAKELNKDNPEKHHNRGEKSL